MRVRKFHCPDRNPHDPMCGDSRATLICRTQDAFCALADDAKCYGCLRKLKGAWYVQATRNRHED